MVEIATGRALRRVTLAQWLDTPELRADMPALGGGKAEIFDGYFLVRKYLEVRTERHCGPRCCRFPFQKLQFFFLKGLFYCPSGNRPSLVRWLLCSDLAS